MAFEPDKWADGEEGNTPITAAELNRMETAGDAAAKTATWGRVSNKPSTFAPADHDHAIADVTGLQSALDGKQASGNYATAAQVNAKADQSALDALEARVAALEEPEA